MSRSSQALPTGCMHSANRCGDAHASRMANASERAPVVAAPRRGVRLGHCVRAARERAPPRFAAPLVRPCGSRGAMWRSVSNRLANASPLALPPSDPPPSRAKPRYVSNFPARVVAYMRRLWSHGRPGRPKQSVGPPQNLLKGSSHHGTTHDQPSLAERVRARGDAHTTLCRYV